MAHDKMKNVEELLGERLRMLGMTVCTAESCTGGGVAARISSVPGSSEYFIGGVVAYSNTVKTDLLHVSQETLRCQGAVSRDTVIEMVRGAKMLFNTSCAIATSGIAGPGGGSIDKPVGTIWIAVLCDDCIETYCGVGDYGRAANVERTIKKSLAMLCSMLERRIVDG